MCDLAEGSDSRVIRQLVDYLKHNGYKDLRIDRWPERDELNPHEIDAIAGSFAIEHASADPVFNPSVAPDWFEKVLRSLEDELQYRLPYRLEIRLPVEGPQLTRDWWDIRESIRSWVVASSPDLPDGMHSVRGAPGIPFDFRAAKKSDSDEPILYFRRASSRRDTFARRLFRHLQPRIDKLAPYKAQGYTTVLMVECCDPAMTRRKMMGSLRCAYNCQLPSGVDLLWYVDTKDPEEPDFHGFTTAI